MFPFFIPVLAFWGTVLGGGFYLALRFVRASERRAEDRPQLDDLRARIAALEESLDGAQADIRRLETGQEFTTRLLGARSAGNADR